MNWGYQVTPIFSSFSVDFVDSMNGWAGTAGIINTTDGGGEIIYDAIKPISKDVPKDYKLFQNYPNPFNPSTKIKFQLPKDGHTNITVFDITGKAVSVLLNDELSAGTYETEFRSGNLSSGVYFYRMTVRPPVGSLSRQTLVYTKKMIVLK